MLLEYIEQNPADALLIMERLVNNGSPDKMKFMNNTTDSTNPWLTKQILVDICIWDKLYKKYYGNKPIEILQYISDSKMFIHPNMTESFGGEIVEKLVGIPTSSARTVFIPELEIYLKLHYPKLLGRVDKSLQDVDIQASIDVTNLLKRAIKRKKVSRLLGFFPEEFGCVGRNGDINISYTVRKSNIITIEDKSISYLCPAFSMYGKDFRNPKELTVIEQLIYEFKGVGKDPLHGLIIPVIDLYLSLLFEEGLQPEMHSQNFLLAFDDSWNLVSIVLRDLESVQKDITIRKEKGIGDFIEGYPHRCIWRGQLNYEEKHSFMYDHKLYEFFIKPLIDTIVKTGYLDKDIIYAIIKEHVNNKYGNYIKEYFPKNGKWYKFEDVIVSYDIKRRLFLECDHPNIR